MKHDEKRIKQRVAKAVPVKIKEKGNIFATETIDISPSGAYCRTIKPMPLLSEVAITLIVSAKIKGEKIEKALDCIGTVVRTHPVIIDGATTGYDIAVFFSDMKKEDRALLSEYIDQSQNTEEEK